MTGRPRLSDHALLRLLEHSGLPVAEVRDAIESSLARAHAAAVEAGGGDHLIVRDGMVYVVRKGVVTTVMEAGSRSQLWRMLQATGER